MNFLTSKEKDNDDKSTKMNLSIFIEKCTPLISPLILPSISHMIAEFSPKHCSILEIIGIFDIHVITNNIIVKAKNGSAGIVNIALRIKAIIHKITDNKGKSLFWIYLVLK